MTKKGMLIVFSGPSGVGKDTVLDAFLPTRPDCAKSVSMTTRPPRPDEIDGTHYHFTSTERFRRLIDQGQMLEHAVYDGHHYGTPKKTVNDRLDQGQNVILKIDLQGARKVKALQPDCLSIFIMPPSWDILVERLRERGTQTPESQAQRLQTARNEILCAPEYDYVIINRQNNLEQCCADLGAVITAAGYAASRMQDFIKEVSSHA